MKSFLWRIFFILFIFTAVYLLYLKISKNLEKNHISEYNNLLQNRISYIELLKLNPVSPNANSDKIDILAKIKETNKKALESKNKSITKLMQTQNEIIDELVKTKSYEDGIKLLKSEKSINFLAELTELIREFEKKTRSQSPLKYLGD